MPNGGKSGVITPILIRTILFLVSSRKVKMVKMWSYHCRITFLLHQTEDLKTISCIKSQEELKMNVCWCKET